MTHPRRRPAFGLCTYLATTVLLGGYFAYASVQGNFGLLRRIEIESGVETLSADLDALRADVASLKNRTTRLSDGYLDLDLLDEQAREILGLVRSDEVILR